MRNLTKSTATDRLVFMTDSTDHIAGKTGLTLTITASKAGAAFASITPTVTERGNGWYSLALTTSHTDTNGDLALHITGSGADPTDILFCVVSYNADDAIRMGLTALPGANADAAGGLPISDAGGLDIDTILGRITANVSTATALATAQSDLTAIKKNAFAQIESAITTVTSQTVFVLTSGPSNDIANVSVIIFDNSNSDSPLFAEGSYVGSTKTLTLNAATDITVTTSDTITLIFSASQSSDVNVVSIATDAISAAAVAAAAVTKIQTGLATSANVSDAQTEIIEEVNANETKIDIIDTVADSIAAEISKIPRASTAIAAGAFDMTITGGQDAEVTYSEPA